MVMQEILKSPGGIAARGGVCLAHFLCLGRSLDMASSKLRVRGC